MGGIAEVEDASDNNGMSDRLRVVKGKDFATPSLFIDAQTVRCNLVALQQYAKQHHLSVRPHTKTHKSLHFAREQRSAGSQALAVAKVGEAEVLSRECNDILIAYPAIDEPRCERIAALARKVDLRVAVDSREGAKALADAAMKKGATIGVLVDQDVGFHRTGIHSPDKVLDLAEYIAGLHDGLRLDGIFFYPGHVSVPANQQFDLLKQIDHQLQTTLQMCRKKGIEISIVSGGSTPTAFQSHFITSQTEIRPGTYVFNDMNTVRGGYCRVDQCAAFVIATVVSTAVTGKAVVDAGTKALASDRNTILPDSGFGHVLEYPEAKIVRLSEEHGELDLSECKGTPRLGEKISIIPNHICPCVNLHDSFLWLGESGQIERMPVDCRGMLH